MKFFFFFRHSEMLLDQTLSTLEAIAKMRGPIGNWTEFCVTRTLSDSAEAR